MISWHRTPVANQTIKFNVFDQRRHPNRVMALTRKQDKANEIAQGIGQRQDFGRQTTP